MQHDTLPRRGSDRIQSKAHIAPMAVSLARTIIIFQRLQLPLSSANAAEVCIAWALLQLLALAAAALSARAALGCVMAGRRFPSVVKFSKIKL